MFCSIFVSLECVVLDIVIKSYISRLAIWINHWENVDYFLGGGFSKCGEDR